MKCEKSVGKIPAGVRKELLIYKIILNRWRWITYYDLFCFLKYNIIIIDSQAPPQPSFLYPKLLQAGYPPGPWPKLKSTHTCSAVDQPNWPAFTAALYSSCFWSAPATSPGIRSTCVLDGGSWSMGVVWIRGFKCRGISMKWHYQPMLKAHSTPLCALSPSQAACRPSLHCFSGSRKAISAARAASLNPSFLR